MQGMYTAQAFIITDLDDNQITALFDRRKLLIIVQSLAMLQSFALAALAFFQLAALVLLGAAAGELVLGHLAVLVGELARGLAVLLAVGARDRFELHLTDSAIRPGNLARHLQGCGFRVGAEVVGEGGVRRDDVEVLHQVAKNAQQQGLVRLEHLARQARLSPA